MKIVIQRVKKAAVSIDDSVFSAINTGLLIFIGIEKGDTQKQADWLANKVALLRCFADPTGKMNLSLADIKGRALVVSQFTLCGDLYKGTRPSFDNAMEPKAANEMYEYFVSKLKEYHIPVKTGIFGAHMEISIVNDGPVTFTLDAPNF